MIFPPACSSIQREIPDGADGRVPSGQSEVQLEDLLQEEVEAELDTVSVVLENIPEKMTKDILEMLVENISDCYVETGDFSLEIIPDISMAVVTFQNGKAVHRFLSSCTSNKMFRQNKLCAKPLEVTTKVKIENIPPNVSTEHLELYFDREGRVEDVKNLENEHSAIITFVDARVVDKVSNKSHQIQRVPIRVYPYYESLGTALYGKDRQPWKLPDSFTESMDSSVWKFLHERRQVEEILRYMSKHFCDVDLQRPIVKISPQPTLLQQKGLTAKHIDGWKENATNAFCSAISRYRSFECQVPSSVWEESEMEIRSALTEAVILVPDMARGLVALAGPSEDVARLEKVLVGVVDRATNKIERESNSIVEEVSVTPSLFHILQKDGLQQRSTAEHPELKMTYNQESRKLVLCGLFPEVYSIKSKVLEQIVGMKRKAVEVDDHVLTFLSEVDREELSDTLFISQGISATYETEGRRVLVLGSTEQVLSEAETQLKKVLGFYTIEVEDLSVLRKPEWQDLVIRLKKLFNTPYKTVTVRRTGPDTKLEVVVSGCQDSINAVGNQLSDFVSKNTIMDETMDVPAQVVVKFIQEHKRDMWSEVSKKDVKVTFNEKNRIPNISLHGPRDYVKDAKKIFGDLLSSLHFDTLTVTKPGAKKFFKDKQAVYLGTAMSQMRCVVQLMEEDLEKGFSDDKFSLQVQMTDGVAIAICKADICYYPADAVVNAANERLKLEGSLAGALLDAAGPELQDECDRLMATRNRLAPGDAVITRAGRLPCKHVVHAVGPSFDPSQRQRSVGLLKRVVKQSLRQAETSGCLSVALPAISSGNLGFPLDLCAETIAQAVKEHCEDLYGENTLKKIHLVNNDDQKVQATEAAVRKVFADYLAQSNPQPQVNPAGKDGQSGKVLSQAGQDRVQTKEGLTIILMKGNIQDASTDVIVNTMSKDLALHSGAVSKAILNAAGPELQNQVNTEAAGSNPGEGSVIVTKGCNLKSKLVFHAIAPHWDKGKGKAEKLLGGIIEKCLEQAEKRQQRSITFSAIGSGNLGFPKDLVASMMLDQVLSFSSKAKPRHLLEVMFVLHPSDMQTGQAFTDEFKKRFSSAAASAPAQHGKKGFFSKVVTSKQGHEMKLGGVMLQVVTGDITKETTDAIVNSSNADFSLRSGVSKAIMDAAGQAVDAECKLLGSQPNTGMIMTQPGNLKSKKIIHIEGQTDPAKISACVKGVLQMCAQNNLTSVSFPALGTGQGGVSASQVADTMLDAVADTVQQNPTTSLQLVRLVIFQAPMLTDFHNSMQKRENMSSQKEKETIWSKFKPYTSIFWKGSDKGAQEDKQKLKDFRLEGEKADPAVFHICGGSQADVENAKRWIEDLIRDELAFQTVTDEAILSLSAGDHHKIREMQKRLGVSVTMGEGDKEASLTVEGLSRDVLNAIGEIQDMVKKIRFEESRKRDAEIMSTLVEWQYQQGNQYIPFDIMANLELEKALVSQVVDANITIQNKRYKVTLPDGPAVDSSGNQLQIKRIDKQEALEQDSLPKHWDPMTGNEQYVMVPLQVGMQEYNEVLGLFQKTCRNQVLKIERVQNPTLWKSFEILKQAMDKKNRHQNNEKRLFHGTSEPTIKPINLRGFNRSYAGKNAAAIGNGTYFAVNASYSASHTYSVPNAQGQKYMYLCRVLTGDFTTGQGGMIVPPAKNSATAELYDSVTDNLATPSMFVIFNDIQAYPEYLITFR
ncbi:poly(ADP-ribose) polymerase family member 14-related sequence 1 [Megalops cyprinoides]|uniref:poly(ADP-ribose) polymerase family member 14-related sequence 1 n=1 Tax=Megalops cyprinoides TaxID=118141 RepID=UPI0018652A03|nr:poly(ADP-ribose) polymerase family member 14-related sequence 1 [Megalops cyprinoides]